MIGTADGERDLSVMTLAEAEPQPGWRVLDAARRGRFTGEVVFDEDGATSIYFDDGVAYFAEREGGPSLCDRLVELEVLSADEREEGVVRIGRVEHVGKLFERAPTVEVDAVIAAVELITGEAVSQLANRGVGRFTATAYRHHPSGVHRWAVTSSSTADRGDVDDFAPLGATGDFTVVWPDGTDVVIAPEHAGDGSDVRDRTFDLFDESLFAFDLPPLVTLDAESPDSTADGDDGSDATADTVRRALDAIGAPLDVVTDSADVDADLDADLDESANAGSDIHESGGEELDATAAEADDDVEAASGDSADTVETADGEEVGDELVEEEDSTEPDATVVDAGVEPAPGYADAGAADGRAADDDASVTAASAPSETEHESLAVQPGMPLPPPTPDMSVDAIHARLLQQYQTEADIEGEAGTESGTEAAGEIPSSDSDPDAGDASDVEVDDEQSPPVESKPDRLASVVFLDDESAERKPKRAGALRRLINSLRGRTD